jgi:hypothetical protein
MELQLGITGIQGHKDPAPEPPFTNLKAFHSHCHHAARESGATVQAIRDPFEAGPSNYAMARIQFSDCVVAVFVNSVRPIIAFAKNPVEGQITFEYIDYPKLASVFLAFGEYTIATSDELNTPLLRAMCKNLAPAEQKRVRYFRPRRVGDVILITGVSHSRRLANTPHNQSLNLNGAALRYRAACSRCSGPARPRICSA